MTEKVITYRKASADGAGPVSLLAAATPDCVQPWMGHLGPAQHCHRKGLCSPAQGQALLLALPLVFYCSFIIHIKPSNMLAYNITFYSTKAIWT